MLLRKQRDQHRSRGMRSSWRASLVGTIPNSRATAPFLWTPGPSSSVSTQMPQARVTLSDPPVKLRYRRQMPTSRELPAKYICTLLSFSSCSFLSFFHAFFSIMCPPFLPNVSLSFHARFCSSSAQTSQIPSTM